MSEVTREQIVEVLTPVLDKWFNQTTEEHDRELKCRLTDAVLALIQNGADRG